MNIVIRFIYFFALLILGFSSYAGTSAGTSLITDDGTQYQVANLSDQGSDIAMALKEDIDSVEVDDSNKADNRNFIFYIHGRGKEPNKSLRDVIPALKKEYSAAVLMFHWFPSYKGPLGYPLKEAEAAAPDLGKALAYFQEYKDKHSDEFEEIKTTMLVHSMGNYVFEKYLETYKPRTLSKGLFDTIILNSADAPVDGHDKWVKKIDFTNNLYITLNEGDNILSMSAKSQRAKRLGQKTTTMTGKQLPLAGNAKYCDFSETGVNHRYFLKAGQEDNRWLKQFYDSVMNGNPVNLDLFPGIQGIPPGNGNKIYVFKGE